MKIIATKKDIDTLQYNYFELTESVCRTIEILDIYYGENRDIFKSLGGFACIADTEDDVSEIESRYYLDIRNDVYEEEEVFDNYIGRLYILSSDYVIKVYFRKELCK